MKNRTFFHEAYVFFFTEGSQFLFARLCCRLNVNMGDNNDSVKITELQDVKDWSRWKFQIRILLEDLEIFGIVTGDIPKPVVERRQNETEAQAHSRSAEELKEWSRKDIKAQKYLSTTIGDQAIIHIMNYGTAKEMWDKLHAVYEQKSETSIHLLQQKFFAYQFEEKGVANHISMLEDLAKQLEDLAAPILPSMLITRILTTLPSSYNHFHAAWESTVSKDRTITNLTSRLLVEEARIAAAEEQFNSTAFAARVSLQHRTYSSGQPNVRKPNQHSAKPGKCFKCDKVGHWRRDCPMLKSGESQKRHGELQRGRNETKVVTSIGNHREDFGDALLCEAFIGEVEFCAAKNESDKWFLDSGASDHTSNKRQWFSNLVLLMDPIPVRIGDGKLIFAIGKGDINIAAFDGINWVEKRLLDVLFVPDIRLQLFSFSTALDKNLTFTANRESCYFSKGDVTVAVGERKGKLFEMKFKVLGPKQVYQANAADSSLSNVLQMWLGHQNINRVKEILKKLNVKYPQIDFFCESCVLGKHHRLPFSRTGTSATYPGNLIHTDTCGPMQERSIGGSRYFVLFKDDYSISALFFLLKKRERSNEFWIHT